jgi:DNA polymerase-3 subunit alpha
VFASKDENACGVYKVKVGGRIEKIANTPEKCFIYNDSVIGVKVPDYLDKQYYIDLANKRLKEFIESKATKGITKSTPSDIKFINQEIKDELIEFSKKDHKTFVDLLIDLIENSSANSRQIEIFIKLNYFKKYGKNKKLLDIFNEFIKGKNKYTKNLSDKTKKQRLEKLYEYEKSVEDMVIPISEQIAYDIEYMGKPVTTYDVLKGTGYILNLNIGGVAEAEVYGLSNGNTVKIKIFKNDYVKCPFKKGDIVQFISMKCKPGRRFVGKDNNGKPIYEIDKTKKEWWSDDFRIIKY